MNYNNFVKTFKDHKILFEKRSGVLYLASPFALFILRDPGTLPAALAAVAEPGDVKSIADRLAADIADNAWYTGVTFRRRDDVADLAIIEGENKNGENYPVFVNTNYLNLMGSGAIVYGAGGEKGPVAVMSKYGTAYILPVRVKDTERARVKNLINNLL